MSVHLPKPIERFLSSENALDPDVLAACFAPDGIVRDEGRTREGLEGIVAWRRETAETRPLAAVERDGKTLSRRKFLEVFPAARSLSILSSVLRTARLHRWTYSLDGYLELKGKRCLRPQFCSR
jgi:hypothetical protein